MNPFVNPNKRSIALLGGCKDLADVLKRSEARHDDAVRRFIYLVLLQAQQDRATELSIGVASDGGVPPMRYKVESAWFDLPCFPSHIRTEVVAELAQMAKFPAGQFPAEGVLDECCGDVRLRWIVGMTSADGECMLTRVQD